MKTAVAISYGSLFYGASIAQRNPTILYIFEGSLELRIVVLILLGVFNHEPPRMTRSVPVAGPCGFDGLFPSVE